MIDEGVNALGWVISIPQFGIKYRLVICEDSVTNPLPVPLSMGYI